MRALTKPSTGGIRLAVEKIDGVIKAWSYRGRIHIMIEAQAEQLVRKCLGNQVTIVRRTRDKIQLMTTWVHPFAEMKQIEAQLAKEAKWIKHHFDPNDPKQNRQEWREVQRNLQSQLASDRSFPRDGVYFSTLHDVYGRDIPFDSERMEELEDKLDNYPLSSNVEPGHESFQYKEDLDLERAQKDERDVDRQREEAWFQMVGQTA